MTETGEGPEFNNTKDIVHGAANNKKRYFAIPVQLRAIQTRINHRKERHGIYLLNLTSFFYNCEADG